jgi:cysteinyl-tRNA synthetase
MADELLGAAFDIHGGGIDLQFPHHENEIAQSCCARPGAGFASVWLHNEMLQVEGKKMSKSLGNFFTVRDLLDQGVPGEVIRFVFLGTHYRKPMDWTRRKAYEAESNLTNMAETLGAAGLEALENIQASEPLEEIVDPLTNDLNTSLALTRLGRRELWKTYGVRTGDADFVNRLYGSQLLLGFDLLSIPRFAEVARNRAARREDGRMAVRSAYAQVVDFPQLASALQELRDEAMISKDFAQVDALKSALVAAGVEVRMSKAGVELVPGPAFDPAKLEGLL